MAEKHDPGPAQPDHHRGGWRLTDAARAGTVIDLTTVDGAPGLPGASLRRLRDLHKLTLPEDWQLPPPQDYPDGAHLPASALRQVLLDPDLDPDPHGLWIHGAVLTGDTILGRGTTILDFPDGTLGDYLASLDVLSGFDQAVMLPAHGPTHPHLGPVIEQYTSHRLQRLEQIREAVARLTGDDSSRQPGTAEVTDLVYSDIDPAVRGAAEHSVKAQLHYLSGITPAP